MNPIIKRALLASVVFVPAVASPIGGAAYAQTASRTYSIPAQDLGDALRQFGNQSGRDIAFDPALTNGKTSKGVQGAHSAEAALKAVLDGTGLGYKSTSSGFALFRSAPQGNALAGAPNAGSENVASSNGDDAVSE
jgi:hypothetical protein